MRLIDADVADIRETADRSRLEADVRLIYAAGPGAPATERIIRGTAALDDPRDRPLRVRLVADALQAALRSGAEGAQDAAA